MENLLPKDIGLSVAANRNQQAHCLTYPCPNNITLVLLQPDRRIDLFLRTFHLPQPPFQTPQLCSVYTAAISYFVALSDPTLKVSQAATLIGTFYRPEWLIGPSMPPGRCLLSHG